MPGLRWFAFIDKVEHYVRTRSYPPQTAKVAKHVIRTASKHYVYKDKCLWRSFKGRLLQVIRSNDEIREILIRYHDNNDHAGQAKMMKLILSLYYWSPVTESVKNWVKNCPVCRNKTPEPRIKQCLAYGCDSSNLVHQSVTFYRFPKDPERRKMWLNLAHRDEGSLRPNSLLCSRHFEQACYEVDQEGQMNLRTDAVPTIIVSTLQQEEVLMPTEEDSLQTIPLEDVIAASAATETTEPSGPRVEPLESPMQLLEHQYSLFSTDTNSRTLPKVKKSVISMHGSEPCFVIYDQITRYLSHRILPLHSKKRKGILKRMAKRFGLIDGELMYTRVSPPVKVPRSREEVNAILQQFHDDQGHYGQGTCQQAILKQFYWGTMTKDLARWINNCNVCLNRTKRRWLRCSVYNCTNCCGPVERGLGMTFHKFPLHNPSQLAQWLKNLGRPNWHPRLWSSVCSAHFTEDCFDRTGERVTLRPEAVPSVFIYSDPVTQSRTPNQPTVVEEVTTQDQIFFAKYDAVERYLSSGVYPAGFSYVEKNTFRRFCKNFTIKDQQLHMVRGGRALLVLRNREAVEAALVEYHNELNHLDVKKCLRLLNERFFWKTMRPDVVRWIDNCSQCSKTKKTKLEPEGTELPELLEGEMTPPEIHEDPNSGNDENVGEEEEQPASHPHAETHTQPGNNTGAWPLNGVQFKTILEPQDKQQPQVQSEAGASEIQPQSLSSTGAQSLTQCQEMHLPLSQPSQPLTQTQPLSQVQKETSGSQIVTQNAACTPQLQLRPQTRSRKAPQTNPQNPTNTKPQTSVKRKLDPKTDSSAKRSSSGPYEPVAVLSNKPWPLFTISGFIQTETVELTTEADSSPQPAPPVTTVTKPRPLTSPRPRKLQARTVVQWCSEAKVKIKPAMDGADAEWAEIQEGMVVYVCFFQGATQEVIQEMANTLLNSRLFRNARKQPSSVLDLPGSILLIPQDSLQGEQIPRRRVQYKSACQPWWGAQLYAKLLSACCNIVANSAKCTEAGVTVEHGIYGQRQEILLRSLEPLTHLLEF
ncbi:uncharacterized protein LOC130126061 [Lampris incognitus]|uniref:uncharacterized protein LOC130126061 n=1 Tax=Lampris incognitus TaxID=2546036 RepID=UPI0024B4B0B7|nr:uncharacterized protein LOC130126061 [Lampris incognitus]